MRHAAAAAFLLLTSCASPPRRPPEGVMTGIDVLEARGYRDLRGKRVGLITNATGRDRRGRGTAELLARAPGVTLVSLFAPEHGYYAVNEYAQISTTTVKLAGRNIPVHSLYSGGFLGMRPQLIDLEQLDVLVFDIQDIGARFYTYLATMGMALEESAKAGIEFVVLDRPNPINGVTIEGPMLDDMRLRTLSPTSYYAIPVRHGMTAGEIALLHNAEVRNPKLTVIPMTGWSRAMWYDQTGLPWTPPSPNMPDLEAATLYPGIAIFEASNIAVGRGTPIPFRWIGAPFIDGEELARRMNAALLEGIEFSPQDYTPSKSVFEGERCHGVRMKITDRDRLRPLAVFRELNAALMAMYPEEFQWRWDELKRMAGTDELHRLIERGADAEKIRALFDRGAQAFETTRRPYLLY